jgi:hypothetical protein
VRYTTVTDEQLLAETTTSPVDVTTEAVLDLYGQFLEAARDGVSSNDIAQLLDDWFTANGFPTVIYRPRTFPTGRHCTRLGGPLNPRPKEHPMSDNLGGPREGNCHAESFTVVSEEPFETRDHKDLGVMPWDDLIAMVEQAGGTRPTFDLFDIPQPDGTVLRYRVMDEWPAP